MARPWRARPFWPAKGWLGGNWVFALRLVWPLCSKCMLPSAGSLRNSRSSPEGRGSSRMQPGKMHFVAFTGDQDMVTCHQLRLPWRREAYLRFPSWRLDSTRSHANEPPTTPPTSPSPAHKHPPHSRRLRPLSPGEPCLRTTSAHSGKVASTATRSSPRSRPCATLWESTATATAGSTSLGAA